MGSKLDVKKWLYATALVFIFMTIFEFLLRRLIFIPWHPELGPPAEQPENIWMLRLWIYLGRVFFSLFFVYIYTRGYEGKRGWAKACGSACG